MHLTNVAGLARESLRTGTEVLVWPRVHAGSTVNARLVAAAVVQICKQKVFLGSVIGVGAFIFVYLVLAKIK